MFDKGTITVDENGTADKRSASDQTIIIRKFGMPVDVEIAGKTFTIKPGSYFLNNLLAKIVEQYRDDNKEIIKQITEADKKATNAKIVESMLTNFKTAIMKVKPAMFKAVQLILLDNKRPDWKKDTDDFPTEGQLEEVMPTKTLEKFATIEEISIVLDAYNQLNKPELPRQNFLRLGEVM